MNIRIQIIICVIIVIALMIIVNMIRKKQLELRYALSWLAVGVAIFILACFPQLMVWISEKIGIANPVNMLFFFGFCFSLIIIFILTVSISRMSIRIKELSQRIALFEEKVNDHIE